MKKIITIDLENAEVGMQLADDAIDKQGVCLLCVGSVLTKGVIKSLKKRNIKQISVYQNIKLSPQQTQDVMERIKNDLDHSFKHLEGFTVLAQLKQIFYNFRTKDITSNND
ncbi:MAG: hypothetical protein ACN4GM_03840 [Gammaproteobacteria bacterium]